MKKTRAQKGITLIALIITIVVLLILAVVAINAIDNEGILSYATNAATDYNKAVANESQMLQNYVDYLEKYNEKYNGGGTTTYTVATAKNKVLSTTSNTDVYDEYGNKIVVPAGFKIVEDADTVTEGIVIEDATKDASGNATSTTGNQFVWIPVGKVYTDTAKTESLAKTIKLGRYTEFTATSEPVQTINNCTEIVEIENTYGKFWENSSPTAFLNSAINNGGYYFGRYQAADAEASESRTYGSSETNKMVCKANQSIVYNYISNWGADSLCSSLYSSNSGVTSSLTCGYAWDTMVIFKTIFGTSANIEQNSGIGDWTTETFAYHDGGMIERGVRHLTNGAERDYYDSAYEGTAFRPILYIS